MLKIKGRDVQHQSASGPGAEGSLRAREMSCWGGTIVVLSAQIESLPGRLGMRRDLSAIALFAFSPQGIPSLCQLPRGPKSASGLLRTCPHLASAARLRPHARCWMKG